MTIYRKKGGEVIAFIENWEQAVTWIVLLVVLYSIVSGKLRYDLTAFGGLLLLGILGIRAPGQLFSGFSSPALFTIATVLVMSAGIVESGLLSGFGKKIASRVRQPHNQILSLFLSTGFISAFMNNVGAIGIFLPTAKRMAKRAELPYSDFGIPIVYASILGGSLTLIGTASNLIISMYRLNSFGEPFKMFDFIFHGMAMLLSGIVILFICRACGVQLFDQINNTGGDTNMKDEPEDAVPRKPAQSLMVLLTLTPIIVVTAMGLIHPSVAFGIITLLWIFSGVLPYQTALDSINLPIIIFLGSMFGISGILEETGALKGAVNMVSPVFAVLPPFFLIMAFVFIAALFANILDNSVASVLMAPVAVILWQSGAVPFNPDALLMAVAAGASLGIVIPTHQATVVVMNSMDFPRMSFIKTGAIIALFAGVFSSLAIYTVWC